MTREIYYFSGTGNSFAVAKDLSMKINAKMIPLASLIDRNDYETNAECIGFVFPIYDFKPPRLVIEFINKFNNINTKYIFAVITYGIVPLKSIKFFDKLLQSNGGKLSAGFAVKMPHNGLGSGTFSRSQHESMFKNWKTKVEFVSEYIVSGKKGKFETSNFFLSLIFSGLLIKRIPFIVKLLKHVMFKGWNSLAYISNEKCDGCGICKKICPVDNIGMIDNKPSWSNHSVGCFACIHWCPKQAIQLGNTNFNIKQYHHPEVKMADIINQKGNVDQ
jgi:Pyruvate/2-oxoacid:ferredoxin oxidoreductase delta subunit/flavodoxin